MHSCFNQTCQTKSGQNVSRSTKTNQNSAVVCKSKKIKFEKVQQPDDCSKSGFYCLWCETRFTLHGSLNRHYNNGHGLNLIETKKVLSSAKETSDFLQKIQKTSYYTLGITNTKNKTIHGYKYTTTYFQCNYLKDHRRVCPAFIITENMDKNHFKIRYILDHNHKPDWKRVTIPPLFKNHLLNQIKLNIPIDDIYSSVLKDFNTNDIKKECFITKHYLYYLRDKRQSDTRDFKDDKNNTKEYLLNNPPKFLNVFLFKDLTMKIDDQYLDKDDFVICYNTKYMTEIYMRFGRKGVLIDSTHSTTKYGLLLVVVSIINENQRGCPFLFILTNSERESVLTSCFSRFYSSLNSQVNPEYMMSDCYTGFYNSWCKAFGVSPIH